MDRREELKEIIRKEFFHEDTFSDLEKMGCPRNPKLEGMFSAMVSLLSVSIISWLSEHYVEKPEYDGGIIKGPFKDCDCESHHQHGRNGPQGCVVCNPPNEHYEEKHEKK